MKDNKYQEKCPFCREEILSGAMVCKHCHSIIKLPLKKKKGPLWRSSYLLGFYSGIIFMAALIYIYTKLL
ncbi:MAG: hypothetical protein NTV06_07455 [candidate division Zixibacteria bacterium]|nr:hypothetical protein [candidate division Zixibacteria bacterium]